MQDLQKTSIKYTTKTLLHTPVCCFRPLACSVQTHSCCSHAVQSWQQKAWQTHVTAHRLYNCYTTFISQTAILSARIAYQCLMWSQHLRLTYKLHCQTELLVTAHLPAAAALKHCNIQVLRAVAMTSPVSIHVGREDLLPMQQISC